MEPGNEAMFLSDVHADRPHEECKDIHYSVTRFKFKWPTSGGSAAETSSSDPQQSAPSGMGCRHRKRRSSPSGDIEQDTNVTQSTAAINAPSLSELDHDTLPLTKKQKLDISSVSQHSDGSSMDKVTAGAHITNCVNSDCSNTELTQNVNQIEYDQNTDDSERSTANNPNVNKVEARVEAVNGDSIIESLETNNCAKDIINLLTQALDVESQDSKHRSTNAVKSRVIELEPEPNEYAITKSISNTLQQQVTCIDDDLDVERKEDTNCFNCVLNIKHSLSTTLDNVGEQVWSGALLLCDYMLHHHEEFVDKVIVDLGAGVGLTSIVSAMFAKTVYCTDIGETILSYARDNVTNTIQCPTLPRDTCPVLVRELDWFQDLSGGNSNKWYSLHEDDVSAITNAHVLLAADVIYDFDITDAFFKTLTKLLNHGPTKTVYIALEQRLVFSVHERSVTSPVYNYFMVLLDDLTSGENDLDPKYRVEEVNLNFGVNVDYKRSPRLELWKISATAT